MPSAPSIRLELRPSRWQRLLIASLTVATIVSLLFAPWPLWLRGLAVAALVVAVAFAIRRHGSTATVRRVEWRADGSWWLQSADATDFRPATFRAARVVGPLLALELLAVADDGVESKRISLSLWPDSAAADELRRLRIRLGRETGTPSERDRSG